VKDGDILEKPKSEADAFKMLKRLSGGAHEVLTGYCLMPSIGPQVIQHIVTEVYFFDLSDALIERYIATREPMDKAGAYGIQGLAASFVEKIEGSYTNVVGLPLSHVVRDLELLEPRFIGRKFLLKK
jgi:septum formation protein